MFVRTAVFISQTSVWGKQSVRLSADASQLALMARFAAHGKSFACWAVAPFPKKSCDFSGTPCYRAVARTHYYYERNDKNE